MSGVDLIKFCGQDLYRTYLNAPFSIGDFTYACNGHIAVRVPRLAEIGEVENAPTGIVGAFVPAEQGKDRAAPLPSISQPKTERCSPCSGTGKVIPCEECKGEGSQECDMGHDHDCEECDGRGSMSARDVVEGSPEFQSIRACTDCDGLGAAPEGREGWGVAVVFPGDNWVALRYANKIAALPGAVWRLTGRETGDPIPFWFEGGEGVVMPMRSSGPGRPGVIYIEEPAEAVA